MSTTNTPTVEQSLAALECSARRWKAAAVVGLVLAFGMGAKFVPEDEGDKIFGRVQAESFELITADGYSMGALGIAKAGPTRKHPQGMLMLAGLSEDGSQQNISVFYPHKEPEQRVGVLDK